MFAPFFCAVCDEPIAPSSSRKHNLVHDTRNLINFEMKIIYKLKIVNIFPKLYKNL